MPTETITTEQVKTVTAFELSGEVCDANANGSERASVRVWVGETAMHFCSHHARKHVEAFITAGYKIEAPEGALDF